MMAGALMTFHGNENPRPAHQQSETVGELHVSSARTEQRCINKSANGIIKESPQRVTFHYEQMKRMKLNRKIDFLQFQHVWKALFDNFKAVNGAEMWNTFIISVTSFIQLLISHRFLHF